MRQPDAADVLIEGAAYISEHGHFKGDLEGPDGSVCAIGSMAQCLYRLHESGLFDSNAVNRAYYAARAELQAVIGAENGAWIADWNDDPSTTSEDVILTMKILGNELKEKRQNETN